MTSSGSAFTAMPHECALTYKSPWVFSVNLVQLLAQTCDTTEIRLAMRGADSHRTCHRSKERSIAVLAYLIHS